MERNVLSTALATNEHIICLHDVEMETGNGKCSLKCPQVAILPHKTPISITLQSFVEDEGVKRTEFIISEPVLREDNGAPGSRSTSGAASSSRSAASSSRSANPSTSASAYPSTSTSASNRSNML